MADFINSLFYLVASFAAWRNVVRIQRDRSVAGVLPWLNVVSVVWCAFGLCYYAGLNQPFSVAGDAALLAMNAWWVVLYLEVR